MFRLWYRCGNTEAMPKLPNRTRSTGLAGAAILVLCSIALAKNKQPKAYPERGRVVAVRFVTRNQLIAGNRAGNPYGLPPSNGISVTHGYRVYRIETAGRFYELEGGRKPTMALGKTIYFRLEKQSAYVEEDKKERKYRIVGEELKPAK